MLFYSHPPLSERIAAAQSRETEIESMRFVPLLLLAMALDERAPYSRRRPRTGPAGTQCP